MRTLIQNKLALYQCQNSKEEEMALNEITQELILYTLSKVNFFEEASFHGGTSLRIIYGVERFSEDLDFYLKQPNPQFSLNDFLITVQKEMRFFEYQLEISEANLDRDSAVKKRFLKDSSIKRILHFQYNQDPRKKIQIKIEIDTNPPEQAYSETKFLNFPYDYALSAHDLPTLFAGKCHALLCRPYTKGRDWFDFSWYHKMKVRPNYLFLQNALFQQGSFKNQKIPVDGAWLKRALQERIEEIDWKETSTDIKKFLRTKDQHLVEIWSKELFLSKCNSFSYPNSH